MSVPHPFRAIRRAGSTSSGGNAHTLGAHMASRSPHPIYVKKGDKVGSVDLAAHNADSISHRRFFVRRGELATTIDHYNNIVNAISFSGSSPNALQNTYPTIVTTNLLRIILSDIGTYSPTMLSTGVIITNNEGKINVGGTPTALTLDQLKSYVPGYNAFLELYTKVESYKKTGSEFSLNPLSSVFASATHNHSSLYSVLGHMHSFNDVTDSLGRIPAYEGHDHDDRYVLKGSSGESGDADLTVLKNVGIYPESKNLADFAADVIDVNKFTSQGAFSFVIGDTSSVTNIPEDFGNALGTVSNIVRGSIMLDVLRGTTAGVKFGTTIVDNYIMSNHTLTNRQNTIVQLMTTDAATMYKDTSGSGKYIAGENLRSFFIRRGYSMDTAWYISSLTNKFLNKTPKEFYDLGCATTNIAASIAETVNSALDSAYRSDFRGDDDEFIITGLVVPSQAADYARVSKERWELSLTTPKSIYPDKDSIPRTTSQYSDWCSWLTTRKRSIGTSTVVFDATKTPYNFLKVAEAYTTFSDLVHYFKGTKAYSKLEDQTAPIVFTTNYAVANGSSKTDITFDVSQNSCSSCNVPSEVDRVLDDTNIILHEYREIVEAGTFAEGQKYYQKKTTSDSFGISEFVEFTDWTVGDSYEANELYKKVALKTSSLTYQWSKRPIVKYNGSNAAASEQFDASKTYYKYDYSLYKFVAISVNYETVGDKNYVKSPSDYSGPLFTDYDLFTFVHTYERILPDAVTYKSITESNKKFTNDHTYYYKVSSSNYIKITLKLLTKNTSSFSTEKRYVIKNELTGALVNTDAATSVTEFNSIVLGANEAIYSIDKDTETSVFRSYEETIPNDGKYLIGVPKYTTSFTSTTDPVYQLAYFIRSTDTVSKTGKKYFTVNSDNRILTRDSTLNTAGVAISGTRYEIFGLEEFFDLWLAVHTLTQTITSTDKPVGENHLLPIYNLCNDGDFAAWEEWEKLMTKLPDSASSVLTTDPSYVYISTTINADKTSSDPIPGLKQIWAQSTLIKQKSIAAANYDALALLTVETEGTEKFLKFNGSKFPSVSSLTTTVKYSGSAKVTDVKMTDSMLVTGLDGRSAWKIETSESDPKYLFEYSVYLVLTKTGEQTRVIPNPLAEITSSGTPYIVSASNLFYYIGKDVMLFRPTNWIDITGTDDTYTTEVYVRKTPVFESS